MIMIIMKNNDNGVIIMKRNDNDIENINNDNEEMK